jgi:putative PIN family toxin of toxin-antitoxin system
VNVVLDTNVLVSGLLSADGPCGRIVSLLVEDVFTPCVDERILREYESVLSRPELQISPEDVGEALDLIRSRPERLAPTPLNARLPDPDDLPFLETAAAAGAVLVTGNRRHFPKRACKDVPVLSPGDFLELLRRAP